MTQPVAPSITVAGNVEGSIVVGDNNFVVNTNNGTIVYQQAAPRVQLRGASPQPPRKPRGFVGRTRELSQLEGWIASSEPVYLYGTAGLGKTSLSKLAANGSAASAMPNGVIFLEGIDAQGTALPFGDLVQAMFDAAYESQPPLKVDLAAARTYLSNLRTLVFLSNVSLSERNLESLADLFPRAPVLIDAEGSLPGDVFTGLDLGSLAREESITLLAERASLGPDELPQAVRGSMAELLSDVPGALVTIGNALREKRLTPEEALQGLQGISASGGSAAEQALDRAYRVVLARLSEDERTMLVQTGAAPGISVDRKWLERVCGGKSVSEALEALELLNANSPRLRLAPALRTVAMEGQDSSAARERLLQNLLAELQDHWQDFHFVQDELGNLLGLLEWCLSTARWSDALALARGMDPFLTLRGHWEGWGKVLEAAGRAAESLGDQAGRGWSLHQQGTWQIGQGNYEAARKLLEQARDLRLSLGDEVGAAYSQHNIDFLSLKAAPPARRPPRRWPWIVGGLIALALLALLFIPALGLLGLVPRPTATLLPTLSPTASATSPASETPSPTSSLTATVSPSATAMASNTPTSSSTATPTFVPSLTGAMLEHDYCFYGPARVYLSYGWGLLPGQTVTALGRNDDGSWIYVILPNFIDQRGKPGRCWFATKSIQLSGDVMSLQPVYPYIVGPPISANKAGYPHLTNIDVSRTGDQVTITWDREVIRTGDRESPTSPLYLAELWLCKGGQLVFTPIGLSTERLVVTDESGCNDLSHGRLFLSEIEGYIGPETLWGPQVPTPTPTGAATPTPSPSATQ